MPVFNQIEPVYVSKEGVSDNLEQNAGHTLSNIILQMSNLSLIGSQLMAGLLEEITNLNKRYYNIKNRIDAMNIKIEKLDPQSEHISPPTVYINKKRNKVFQYKPVLLRNRLPQTLADQYNRCEPPPPFQVLFGQITSTQDCESNERFKFYSNTNYFKESWYEKKKQDKIRKRILKNKLLKLQTAEIVNVFEQDDKFYPVPLHPVKPRITTENRKQLQSPPVTEPQIEESIPQSDNDAISQYSYKNENAASSFDTYSQQDSFNYSEFDIISVYSRQQDSYNDDSSVIYEIFESADLSTTNSSTRLDKLSSGDTAMLIGEGNQSRAMEPILTSLSQTGSTDEYSETKSEILGRRIIPVRERHDSNRRESAVKDLLRSFVLERRRYINESSSCSSQYSDESSIEYSESDGDD